MKVEQSLTLTLPKATTKQIEELADELYLKAEYIPEVSVDGQQISVSGTYKSGKLEEILQPYLEMIEDTIWRADMDSFDPEYIRIKNHELQWCDVAPSGEWHSFKEIEGVR